MISYDQLQILHSLQSIYSINPCLSIKLMRKVIGLWIFGGNWIARFSSVAQQFILILSARRDCFLVSTQQKPQLISTITITISTFHYTGVGFKYKYIIKLAKKRNWLCKFCNTWSSDIQALSWVKYKKIQIGHHSIHHLHIRRPCNCFWPKLPTAN